MRNIFDQYSQPENQLTHALACTLHADRALIRPFLKWAGLHDIPPVKEIQITEQQVPGNATPGDEDESRGLPDACLYTKDGWVLMIEAKIQAGISIEQLARHARTAACHEFHSPHLLLISVDKPTRGWHKTALHREWRDLYCWLYEHAANSAWAQRLAEYLERFENRMIAMDYGIRGTLTKFNGLRFSGDSPYTYGNAKRLIRLLGDELQKRKDLIALGVDPKGSRRSAITGRTDIRIWDFLPLKTARGATHFTSFPHLTMGIHHDNANASITVPNGIKGGFKTKLRKEGMNGFLDLLRQIERNTRPVLAKSQDSKARVYALQRHFKYQRTGAQDDARLVMDLRTIVPGKRRAARYQPEWAHAIYEIMSNKRSNIQLGFSVEFSYDCPIVQSPGAVDLFAESWTAMSPVIDFAVRK